MGYKEFFKDKETAPVFVGSFPAPDKINFVGGVEVAFLGRSNVGKSSLINALTRTEGLAKTSSTPGRTQMINMFRMGDYFCIVDLPGYGFASAPKKLVDNWTKNTRKYMLGRLELQRVFLLIDSRHGVKKIDEDVMDVFDETGLSYQIILTKTDKISETQLKKIYAAVLAISHKHPALHPTILYSSSQNGDGLDEVRKEIYDLYLLHSDASKVEKIVKPKFDPNAFVPNGNEPEDGENYDDEDDDY